MSNLTFNMIGRHLKKKICSVGLKMSQIMFLLHSIVALKAKTVHGLGERAKKSGHLCAHLQNHEWFFYSQEN